MISLNTIETIVNQHKQDINSLGIPNLTHSSNILINQSPYILKYKLQTIRNSLNNLNLKIHQHNNKSYNQVRSEIDRLLVSELDEKEYIINQLTKLFEFENEPEIKESEEKEVAETRKDSVVGEDLTTLRQRLLSSSTKTLDGDDSIKLNEYHDSLQNEILSDLSELTKDLKTSALKLSSKILNDDLIILNETNENIIKNSNLFKVVDKNLGKYLENKTGGKISLWLLLKLFIILAVVFMFMILFISIVPRLR
ncbi:unnamed protein product [Candida verbasci]|uniref:Uncharacterized protein n=1 Tax=Candida verbasci TaxID=1227364 RepID=A0A9W4XCI2_9ASCO|nr:unnamed protein product [Candida verbasci]